MMKCRKDRQYGISLFLSNMFKMPSKGANLNLDRNGMILFASFRPYFRFATRSHILCNYFSVKSLFLLLGIQSCSNMVITNKLQSVTPEKIDTLLNQINICDANCFFVFYFDPLL